MSQDADQEPDAGTVAGLIVLLERAVASLEAATERTRQLHDRVEALEAAIVAAAVPPSAPGA